MKTPCEFLTGAAGTGKSYTINQRLAEDPKYGLLCATTGIAATNLGNAITVNSALKFFDTASLENNFIRGKLLRAIKEIASTGTKRVIIDEVSMMDGRQLDILVQGFDEYNMEADIPLGLMLTGDFLQLPPIGEKGSKVIPWAFKANSWKRFEENTEKLTKVWRQSDPTFLEALNKIRRGDGSGVMMLPECGVKFVSSVDYNFNGTTLVSKNDEVDRVNNVRLLKLGGKVMKYPSKRWWDKDEKMPGEWKNIPQENEVMLGSLVMILANDSTNWTYVNGDLGEVVDFGEDKVVIKLKRNDNEVVIRKIHRKMFTGEEPLDLRERRKEVRMKPGCEEAEPMLEWGKSYQDKEDGRFVNAEVSYLPIRPAYATTVHKSQGLTLDFLQIDPSSWFFKNPGMVYVALSRCKTPENIYIVGSPRLLAEKVKVDKDVLRFA